MNEMGQVPQEMLTAYAEMSAVWSMYFTPDLAERKRKTARMHTTAWLDLNGHSLWRSSPYPSN